MKIYNFMVKLYYCLYNLAYDNQENKEKISNLVGIEVVLDNMERYIDNIDIQLYGKALLKNMKDHAEKNKRSLEPSSTTDKDNQEPNGSNGPNGPPQKKLKTSPQNIPENSLVIHYKDGKYVSTEGIEFIPSMKALCNTQEEVAKVVVKKEED